MTGRKHNDMRARAGGLAVAAVHAERKLVTILAADVAGYSRLVGADEEGTLRRRKVLRSEVIDPKIAERRGRIVKTTGDGMHQLGLFTGGRHR